MTRAGVVVLSVLALACKGGEDPELDSSANRPPVIDELQVTPPNPRTIDGLSLAVHVYDLDGDPVRVEIEWYSGNAELAAVSGATVAPREFARGELVYAMVTANDGAHRVTAKSRVVEIENAAPVVMSVRLDPETAVATDVLTARVEGGDVDGDVVEYRYRWQVNAETVAAETATLPAGSVVRGDEVTVSVAGNDGQETGQWLSSAPLRVGNAAPLITTEPVYTLNEGGLYTYDVAAIDPDGDEPLVYELIEGPDGMTVDPSTGVVSWRFQDGADGLFPVELSVTDPYAGRTLQRYALELQWEPASQPASPR